MNRAKPKVPCPIEKFTEACGKVSHDLRTPLGVLQGLVDDVSQGFELERQDFIDARESIAKMRTLLDALTDCSQFEFSVSKELDFLNELQERYALKWQSLGAIELHILERERLEDRLEEATEQQAVKHSREFLCPAILKLFDQVLTLFFCGDFHSLERQPSSAEVRYDNRTVLELHLFGLLPKDEFPQHTGTFCGELSKQESGTTALTLNFIDLITLKLSGSCLYSFDKEALVFSFS